MAQTRKKLPVDIQSFEVMRTENYLYVDKTQHIYRLVTEGRFYFLSRPRRFGKSLLVSTLTCLFQGRKELFKGLWIAEHSDWNWQTYPMIVLDFNRIPGSTPDELTQGLAFHLTQIAQQHGIRLDAPGLQLQFDELLLKLWEVTGQPVVVLIDEYDKRIIDHLGKGPERLEIAKANRDVLKSFFGVLKGQEISGKLRLVFLTGVSRFSKVSIFSELNNLRDLSLSTPYADLLGYTQDELTIYFQADIADLAAQCGLTVPETLVRLAQEYNGYRFSKRECRMYNPFSILNALNERDFRNYWFESATPTFLIQLLQERHYAFPELENLEMDQDMTTYDLENLRPEALLFQTGYLTIKDVRTGLYILDYPNHEVKQSFLKYLLEAMRAVPGQRMRSSILRLGEQFAQQRFDAFFETLRAIFASIPYDIQAQRDEAYYHTIFYLVVSASGMSAESSVLTCDGRIDLVISFPVTIYIIEFKCNHSAEAAIRQIHANRYADRFRDSGKPVTLMGINFNTDTRNLEEWKLETL